MHDFPEIVCLGVYVHMSTFLGESPRFGHIYKEVYSLQINATD